MPAIVAVGAGLLFGWLSGGRFGNLAQPWLRFEGLIIPLFIVQGIARGRLVSGLPSPHSGGFAVWVGSSLILALILTNSARRPGVLLAIIGILANVCVVLLNSAMPVAVTRGLVAPPGASIDAVGFYRLVNEATLAPVAGDILPLRIANGLYIMSPGDVMLFVAVITVLLGAMLSRQGADSTPDSDAMHK